MVLRPLAVKRGTFVVTIHFTRTLNGAGIPGLLVLWAEVCQVAQVDDDDTVTAFVVSNPEGLEKDFVAIVEIGGTACFVSD
jgi:hypothetical protein